MYDETGAQRQRQVSGGGWSRGGAKEAPTLCGPPQLRMVGVRTQESCHPQTVCEVVALTQVGIRRTCAAAPSNPQALRLWPGLRWERGLAGEVPHPPQGCESPVVIQGRRSLVMNHGPAVHSLLMWPSLHIKVECNEIQYFQNI